MTSTIIHIDMEAVDKRLQHGKLWTKTWGNYVSADGATCLHGAIRYCQPVPGDAHIIEQVGDKYGFGTSANDKCDTWACVVDKVIPDITAEMLVATFGPQWQEIVAFVRRAAVLTSDEADELDAARGAARDAAWDAAWVAARDAARVAAWDAAQEAAFGLAVRDAAFGLAVRDMIGQHGLTQDHYDTLTAPWASTIGKVHPDDADRLVAS